MCSQGMARQLRFRPQTWFLCLLVTIPFLLSQEAAGQATRLYAGETSIVDRFGNAMPRYVGRRELGVPGDPLRQTLQRKSRVQHARVDRRGVLDVLSQPNQMFRVMQARQLQYSNPGRYASVTMRRNYARYGGFAPRPISEHAGNLAMVFQRHQALIQATGLNAPVHRARIIRGLESMGLPTAVSDMGASLGESADFSTGVERLGERLRVGVKQSQVQARAEAWDWFHKGNEDSAFYRRAAHGFKAAVTLDPMDFESRIGEVFSHVSLGAFRTSIVLLANMSRRDPALFSHPLDFAKLYADEFHARQVCMQCEAFARASGGDPGAMALQVFVLWYSGERDQAILAADALAGTPGGGRFAHWGTQMREAIQAPSVTGEFP